MNGKKAKQLRKVGKVDKKDKKLYNSLTSEQRTILGMLYTHIISKHEEKETDAV